MKSRTDIIRRGSRLAAMLLWAALLTALLPAGTARAEDYLDADGTVKTSVSVTIITDRTTELRATGDDPAWFKAESGAHITSRITCTGDIRLILCDGCTMRADAGITVSGENNKLTIYAGRKPNSTYDIQGTGKLIATGLSSNAAIGGTKSQDGGNITVNGGIVEASSQGGAAIGGGEDAWGKNITINGGTVIATAYGKKGAAIGGGRDSGESAANIRINGGTVIATSTGVPAIGICTSSASINGGCVYAEYTGDNPEIGCFRTTSGTNVNVQPNTSSAFSTRYIQDYIVKADGETIAKGEWQSKFKEAGYYPKTFELIPLIKKPVAPGGLIENGNEQRGVANVATQAGYRARFGYDGDGDGCGQLFRDLRAEG